jgi:hypothetical protein
VNGERRVIEREVRSVESEAGDQYATVGEHRCQIGEHGALGPGVDEGDDVSRGDDQIETLGACERCEVRFEPGELGRRAPCLGQHRRVGIHSGALEAQLGQPDRNPPGAATRIEDARTRRDERRTHRRLAVNVLTALGQPREPVGVLASAFGVVTDNAGPGAHLTIQAQSLPR